MDQIDAMRIYARVAELGSFTATADTLGLLKATVSNAVQQLENALGTRLLHRTTRKVQMTQDGQLFYERCKDLLVDFEELTTLFASSGKTELRGRLRVDMPLALARDVVIPRLPEFLQHHPQLHIEISSTDRRVDLVREGFDCVLRVGALGDESLVAVPIGSVAQTNCASRDYIARHGMPTSLDDLAQHQLIHYVQTLGNRPSGFEYVATNGEVRTVAMQGVITVNNSDAYRAACCAGLGLIQAPRLGHYLADGSLVEVLPDYRAPDLQVSIVYAHRRNLPLRVKAFIEWMKVVLQDSPV